MKNELPTIYQEYIHKSRYARWDSSKKRRENWNETVQRYINYWKNKYPDVVTDELAEELYNSIYTLKTMPSMRALMTAGKALDKDTVAGYNCSFTAIDNPKKFDEILYILACGTGVGFSVERQFVAKLPTVAEEFYPTETVIKVADSKLGWASAFRELISLLYAGKIPTWDLSAVRPAGAVLKTFGGRASGPDPLNDLFKFTVNLFKNAAGRKLTSLECHDLVCEEAVIIICGGVRRCESYKAKVETKSGEWKQLDEVKVGDWVRYCGDIFVEVLNVFDNGIQETLEIKLDNGTSHFCTAEHRWLVYNNDTHEVEEVQTKDLSSGNYSMLEPK